MLTTNLKIITPNGIFLEEDVEIATVTTLAGQIGIQANRVPFASYIQPSFILINWTHSSNFKKFWTNGALVYAEKSFVKIITDNIQSDIDEATIEANKQKQKHEASTVTGSEVEIKRQLKKNFKN
ncbi:ATP synthase F1 subunit epsilon [Mycoplasma iguanae]|uniref:ATP synthase epsilon chain n=1 Tax=Mycoplasma iguanae TaxID=292461 RepID=A0ABY5R8T4_9MOLU|nr:ATP synthase F1 subunit epsilon [Mycoplasma iguanae]UVD81854.1 ATP synthase F1 subunit epsilon [Mycoplasma iguanae]